MEPSSGSLRILIIEDSHDFVYLLRSLFESMGHQCIAAYDGMKGIHLARETKPDVIFCDIGLPKMNGFEVAKAIKAEDSLKGICLVALTGYTGQRNLDHAADAGFNYHLAKPAGMAELSNILDMIRNRSH